VKTDSNTGYNFEVNRSLTTAKTTRSAIEISVQNYFRNQLGLSEEFCRDRAELEEERAIPKAVLNQLRMIGWKFDGKKVLDVGAGQGGMVLELVEQGIDAYGIEPGQEFASLTRMRLREAGHNPDHLITAVGESLPFPNNYFDHVISLQVLEHVADSRAVLREIFRVLRPGGECAVSFDNYLSFREPHYRVAWLPLMPKTIGSLYLRIRGRDPQFLKNYIYYRTYYEICRICTAVGFENVSNAHWLKKLEQPHEIRTPYLKYGALLLGCFSKEMARSIILGVAHFKNLFKSAASLILRKPESRV
jgi:ubiquinone/menaquinone biosynthesis C-methylase UbiE